MRADAVHSRTPYSNATPSGSFSASHFSAVAKTLRWSFAGLSPGRLLDELMQRIRQFAVLIGAALAQLSRYLFGNVANPTFREVKANDANRVAVLAFQQIVDDSFKIGVFNVCLAPGTTHRPKSSRTR